MMKPEFEEIISRSVSAEDYEMIETVYTWHPSISEIDGKGQIARLYTDYGMTVIRDMLLRAKAMQQLDKEMGQARKVVEDIRDRMKELRQ